MKKFDTTVAFIASHIRSSGYTSNEIIETLGYSTVGAVGGSKWRSTGNVITASQTPLLLNDVRLSDASGNEFQLMLEESGIIDLNVLGGTSASFVNIANAAGLTYSQGLTSDISDDIKNQSTVDTMKASGGFSVGNAIETAEFSTGNGGGGTYDAVLSSGVTANPFNIIESTADPLISFVLREEHPLDVRTYGVNVNAADNQAAMQQIADNGVPSVKFTGSGDFTFLSGVNFNSPIVIYQYGSSKIKTSTHFIVFQFNASDSFVIYLEMDGPNDDYTDDSMGLLFTGTTNTSSSPTYVSRVAAVGCKISNFGRYGIFFAYCRRITAGDNDVSSIGYAGIAGISCRSGSISNNDIRDIVNGSPDDAYGIFVDRSESEDEVEHPRSTRISITENKIDNIIIASGGGQAINTHAGTKFTIDSNIIKDTQSSIRLAPSKIAGVEALACKKCTVSNNTMSRSLSGSVNVGMSCNGALNGSTVVEYAEDNTFSDNVMVGYGNAGETTSAGFKIQATKNLKFDGNNLKSCSANSIYINFENINFTIANNTLTDPWDDSVTAPSCIEVDGGDNTGRIANNTYVFDDAALGTFVAVRSISISGSLTGLDIDLKDSSFMGIDASHLNSSVSTTTGVNQTGLYSASGVAAVSITSGSGQNTLAVVFDKRFPHIPNIQLTPRHTFTVGGKNPIVGITNSPAVSRSGFTIAVEPADNTTWGGNATLNVFWSAS